MRQRIHPAPRNTASMGAVGRTYCPCTYDPGYFSAFSLLKRRSWPHHQVNWWAILCSCSLPKRRPSSDSCPLSTVVVGGNYGRGWGKTRSWSGEITVADGGNFSLEARTGRAANLAVLCTCVLKKRALS